MNIQKLQGRRKNIQGHFTCRRVNSGPVLSVDPDPKDIQLELFYDMKPQNYSFKGARRKLNRNYKELIIDGQNLQ